MTIQSGDMAKKRKALEESTTLDYFRLPYVKLVREGLLEEVTLTLRTKE